MLDLICSFQELHEEIETAEQGTHLKEAKIKQLQSSADAATKELTEVKTVMQRLQEDQNSHCEDSDQVSQERPLDSVSFQEGQIVVAGVRGGTLVPEVFFNYLSVVVWEQASRKPLVTSVENLTFMSYSLI